MPGDSTVRVSDIKDRITISLPSVRDRAILVRIMNRYGTSKSGGIRIALREYDSQAYRQTEATDATPQPDLDLDGPVAQR